MEALIVEVTANRAAEFGIQWQSLNGLGGNSTQGFGGTNFGTTGQNIIGISQNPSTVATGLNVGIVNGDSTGRQVARRYVLHAIFRYLRRGDGE